MTMAVVLSNFIEFLYFVPNILYCCKINCWQNFPVSIIAAINQKYLSNYGLEKTFEKIFPESNFALKKFAMHAIILRPYETLCAIWYHL